MQRQEGDRIKAKEKGLIREKRDLLFKRGRESQGKKGPTPSGKGTKKPAQSKLVIKRKRLEYSSSRKTVRK